MVDPPCAASHPHIKFKAMYTAQTRKKRKTWQDGVVVYTPSKVRLILKDDSGKTIAGHWYYKEPQENQEIEFDSYIVQIESQLEVEDVEQSQPLSVLRRPPASVISPQDATLQNLLTQWKKRKLVYVPSSGGGDYVERHQPEEPPEPVLESDPEPVVYNEIHEPESQGEPHHSPRLHPQPSEADFNWGPSSPDQVSSGPGPYFLNEPQLPQSYSTQCENLSFFGQSQEFPVASSQRVPASQVVFPLASSQAIPSDSPDSPAIVDELTHEAGDSIFDLGRTDVNQGSPDCATSPTANLHQPVDTPPGNTCKPFQQSSSPREPTPSPLRDSGEKPSLECGSPRSSQQATQEEIAEPISRASLRLNSGPSLDSLLQPSKQPQGLLRSAHATAAIQARHPTFKPQEEDDCELLYTKKKPQTDWIKGLPESLPASGPWTWEGYWLVNYRPKTIVKQERQ